MRAKTPKLELSRVDRHRWSVLRDDVCALCFEQAPGMTMSAMHESLYGIVIDTEFAESYVRTKHKNLRCFPKCAVLHVEQRFCGRPIQATVRLPSPDVSRMNITVVGELRNLRTSPIFQMGQIYSKFKTDDEIKTKLFQGQLVKSLDVELKFIMPPPRKWHYPEKIRDASELHVCQVYVVVSDIVVATAVSRGFSIQPIWRGELTSKRLISSAHETSTVDEQSSAKRVNVELVEKTSPRMMSTPVRHIYRQQGVQSDHLVGPQSRLVNVGHRQMSPNEMLSLLHGGKANASPGQLQNFAGVTNQLPRFYGYPMNSGAFRGSLPVPEGFMQSQMPRPQLGIAPHGAAPFSFHTPLQVLQFQNYPAFGHMVNATNIASRGGLVMPFMHGSARASSTLFMPSYMHGS